MRIILSPPIRLWSIIIEFVVSDGHGMFRVGYDHRKVFFKLPSLSREDLIPTIISERRNQLLIAEKADIVLLIKARWFIDCKRGHFTRTFPPEP